MKKVINECLPYALIALMSYFGVLLFYEALDRLVFSEKVVVEQAAAPSSEPSQSQTVESSEQPVDYGAILRRNLFGPPPAERNLVTTAAEPVEELEATTLELVLMGTIFTRDEDGRAIILNKKDRKQEIYRVGDQVQGAVIKEIRRGNIVLTVDGQNESLDMREANKYAPRSSTRPVAANLPRRLPAVLPGPDGEEASAAAVQRVRPRVVRPSRKIVSSRRTVVPAEPEEMEEETALEEQDAEVEGDDVEAEEAQAE